MPTVAIIPGRIKFRVNDTGQVKVNAIRELGRRE